MSKWKEYLLEDVIDKFIDYRGKTPNKTSYGIPLITAKVVKGGRILDPKEFITEVDYDSWMTRGFPEINDIVLTTEAPLGEVALIKNKKIALAQRVITLQTKKEICDSVFLKYYLQSKDGQGALQSRSSGSTVEGIKAAELKKMEISLPSLSEQNIIASILSSLDDKIDLLYRQNKTLEAMAETLFRQWFVEEAEDSWTLGKISDLIEFNPKRSLSKGAIAPYLEMSNLSNELYYPTNWYDREFSSGTKFVNGDTLLARITPCLENGKTAFVDFLEEDQVGWGSTEYIVMRSKMNLHPYFSYVIARYEDFRNYAIGCMVGSSGRQRVDVDNIMNYEIQIPSEKTIEKFNRSINTILLKMNNNNIQSHSLVKLRDELLPKLMSGEVMVK
jgi:type I restriction enzyme S subunit